MRILHTVEQYHPSVGGMQEVVKRLSELMVSRGHEVTVATGFAKGRPAVVEGVRVEPFELAGSLLIGIQGSEHEVRRYQNFVCGHFDVVVNFAAQQWASDLCYEVLPLIKARRVFVPTGFSALDPLQWRHPALFLRQFLNRVRAPRRAVRLARHFSRVAHAMNDYDDLVFLSHRYKDARFARKHGHQAKSCVIPNGASRAEFESAEASRRFPGLRVVLHVGSHTRLKGHAEMLQMYTLSEERDTVLWLVGNEFPGCSCGEQCRAQACALNNSDAFRRLNKRVVVEALDRASTVAAFHRADLFLFPSNVECSPIVCFESMASQTPFLATDVGNVAEIVEWSGGGVILPTRRYPDGIVGALIPGSVSILDSLLRDEAWRGRLALAGHSAWRERFTWEQIAGEYLSVYQGLRDVRRVLRCL